MTTNHKIFHHTPPWQMLAIPVPLDARHRNKSLHWKLGVEHQNRNLVVSDSNPSPSVAL